MFVGLKMLRYSASHPPSTPPVMKIRSTPRPYQIRGREKILHGNSRGAAESRLRQDTSLVDGSSDELFL
jgi:hypothetical protein